MDESFENRLKMLEGTKQEINSMENKLHDMLTLQLGHHNLFLQLQQVQVPCHVYFTTTCVTCQDKLIIKMLPRIETIHPHILCKHFQKIHVVDNKKGVLVMLMLARAQKIVLYFVIGLTIFSLLLKIDAHVVVGVDNMIPNVEKGLTLALDIQSLDNYLPTYGISGRFDSFQIQTTLVEKEATSKMTENKDVEEWLVDFLKGQNISKLFGLIRIQYHKMKSIKHGPFI